MEKNQKKRKDDQMAYPGLVLGLIGGCVLGKTTSLNLGICVAIGLCIGLAYDMVKKQK